MRQLFLDYSSKHPRYFNLILFAGFPLLLWIILNVIFGFDGFYGQDSYAYLQQAIEIKSGDFKPWFYPPGYAFWGVVVSYLLGNVAVALQLVSVLSVGFTALAVHGMLNKLYPNAHNWLYVFVGFLCSAYLLRSGVIVMSDASAMLFVTLSFYLFTLKKDYVMLVLLVAAFALLSRYAVAPLLIPVLIAHGVKWWKHKKLAIPIIAALAGVVLIFVFYTDLERSFGYKNHYLISMWGVLNFFKTSFITPDGTQLNTVPNIIFVFCNFYHIGFLPLFFLALWKIKKLFPLSKISIILMASIALYILFLAGVPYQNIRFHIPAAPFAFMLLYPAFQEAFIDLQKRIKWFSLVLALYFIGATLLTARALKPTIERNNLEKDIASELTEWQGETLYAFDMDISLKGRGLKFDYKNLWEVEYADFEKGALVLFNPTKFERQWEGKNPMFNWKELQSTHDLELLEELPEGWELYRIDN